MAAGAAPGPDRLPPTADVILIGGGPAGAAAAWALRRADPRLRLLILEAGTGLASGSSTASLEAFRTCWPAGPLARMMRRSLAIFSAADDYLGEGAARALAVRRQGYLWCAFSPERAAALRAEVARARAIGLPHIEYLDADAVRARFGWAGERVIAARFDPQAGWLDSHALVHWLARGIPACFGIREARIVIHGGRVQGVATAQGTVSAPRVVLAAGAGSIGVARASGLALPVVVRPRQSFAAGWRHEAFPADAPLLIGGPPFPHVRPEAGAGAMFGWEYSWRSPSPRGDGDPPDALREPAASLEGLKDPRFPSLTLALLARQFGHREGQGFADPRYLRGLRHQIGYYVQRGPAAAYRAGPDGESIPYESERAILDAYPGVEGLVLSVAHVGHGIMSAPAGGEIAACHVLGLPLPDPAFAAFGIGVPWVEYDENAL